MMILWAPAPTSYDRIAKGENEQQRQQKNARDGGAPGLCPRSLLDRDATDLSTELFNWQVVIYYASNYG